MGVEGYKSRRHDKVVSMARSAASRAVAQGRTEMCIRDSLAGGVAGLARLLRLLDDLARLLGMLLERCV